MTESNLHIVSLGTPDRKVTNEEMEKREEDDAVSGECEEDEEPVGNLRAFLDAINPINTEEWPEMRWWSRIYEVFKVTLDALHDIVK